MLHVNIVVIAPIADYIIHGAIGAEKPRDRVEKIRDIRVAGRSLEGTIRFGSVMKQICTIVADLLNDQQHEQHLRRLVAEIASVPGVQETGEEQSDEGRQNDTIVAVPLELV